MYFRNFQEIGLIYYLSMMADNIETANEISLGPVFEENIQEFLVSIGSTQTMSNIPFIIQPLITAVSHLMGFSKIQLKGADDEMQEQGLSIFSALVSLSGRYSF